MATAPTLNPNTARVFDVQTLTPPPGLRGTSFTAT